MAERSAYAILGLAKGASDQEIKLAYVEMVKKYDPEKHTDRFMIVQGAYNKLKDTRKRAKEDVHTYNPASGDFMFTADERTPQDVPTDRDVESAHEGFKRASGEAKARDVYFQLLMRRSYVRVQRKLWSEAIEDWERIQQIDPSHVRARHNLILAYLTLGHSYALHELHDEALILWEKALGLNPEDAGTVHNLALVSEKANESAKAGKYWAETVTRWKARLAKEPDNEYLKECIIEALNYHGGEVQSTSAPSAPAAPRAAGASSTSIPRMGGGHGQASAPAASGATATADPTVAANNRIAIERYKEVLKLRPDDFDAQYQIALAYMEAGSWNEAIEMWEKLAAQHPKNVEVLNQLGWAMLNSGRVDQGFNVWNRSLAIDPKNASTRENVVRAHLQLGKQYRQKGLFTPALVHLKKLLRYMPSSAEVFMEIAATYDMKGDTRSARQAYQQVLTLDPKHKLARKALNDLRMK